MKNIISLLFAVVIFAFVGQAAYACSCVVKVDQPAVNYQQWAKDFDGAAFSGRVVKIEPDRDKYQNKVTFSVDSYWRGGDMAEVSIYTGIDSGMCGVSYVVGKTYVVIAGASDRKLWTGSCSEMEYSQHQLSYLNALGKARAVVKPNAASGEKIDEFGNVNCEGEMARLDSFTLQLQNDPDGVGYLIIYGGRTGKRNEAKARAARMSYYLTKNRGVDSKRIVAIDGGYRETFAAELWITKPGESAPRATPTLAAKDVKFKGTAKIRRYSCGSEMGK